MWVRVRFAEIQEEEEVQVSYCEEKRWTRKAEIEGNLWSQEPFGVVNGKLLLRFTGTQKKCGTPINFFSNGHYQLSMHFSRWAVVDVFVLCWG